MVANQMLLKGSFVVAALAILLYWRLASVGSFRSVAEFENVAWDCKRAFEKELGIGSEDLTVDESGRFVIISSMSFFNVMKAGSFASANGKLWRLDMDSQSLSEIQVVGVQPLSPHGVDLVGSRLFVVAHSSDGDCVHVFRMKNNFLEAVLERSFCSDLIPSPNAVAGLPDGSFYVANDHSRSPFKAPLLALAETILGFASSSVVYCGAENTTTCQAVISGLPPSAVGIASRGNLLFVSVPFRGSVEVFEKQAGKFVLVKSIAINSGADNLKWSGNDLWIGSHPKLLQVPVHLNIESQSCPAQVIVVRNAAGREKVETAFQCLEGKPVSAVSTGLLVRDQLLLGTVRDGFAVCTRKGQK